MNTKAGPTLKVSSIRASIVTLGIHSGRAALHVALSSDIETEPVHVAEIFSRLLANEFYRKDMVLVIEDSKDETLSHRHILDLIAIAKGHFDLIRVSTNGTNHRFYKEAIESKLNHDFETALLPERPLGGEYHVPHRLVCWWATELVFPFTHTEDAVPDWALVLGKPLSIVPRNTHLPPDPHDYEVNRRAMAYAIKHNLRYCCPNMYIR